MNTKNKKGLIIQSLCAFSAGMVYLKVFNEVWPGEDLGIYLIYVLDSKFLSLVLFPLILLILTGDKHNDGCRYPVLLRYKNRNDFFYKNVLAKTGFTIAFWLVTIGAMVLSGSLNCLLYQKQQITVTVEGIGIVIKMLLNILCYLWFMILLYEMLSFTVKSHMIRLMCTTFLPILNLMIAKLQLTQVVLWTPWGNIAYTLAGQERSDYHFYWWYWLLLICIVLYLADFQNRRKDYTFEENNKAG